MFKHFPFIHNHGEFVHLDALRDWLRGVVSLDTFLNYHNDKAIVKDMHFTDELTSVDYIDTNNDQEKNEVLCKYLTSSVFDPNSDHDNIKYNKIDHIRFNIDKHNERWIDVREKENGKMRNNVFLSNVPVAYEATDDFSRSNHTNHLGVNEYGVNIYSDDTLRKTKGYSFAKPAAYNVDDDNYDSAPKAYYFGFNHNGVKIFNSTTKEVVQRYQYKDNFTVESLNVTDVNPFGSCYETETGVTINATLHQPAVVTNVNGTIIDGQFMYELETPVTIQPGKSVTLSFLQTPSAFGGLGDRKFSKNFFAKHIEVLSHDGQANNGVITTLSRDKNYPIGHGNITVVLFNTTDLEKTFDTFLFTF